MVADFKSQFPKIQHFSKKAKKELSRFDANDKKEHPFRDALICVFYFKNPLTMCSSASASVSPKVISLMSCSPAILPMAAS